MTNERKQDNYGKLYESLAGQYIYKFDMIVHKYVLTFYYLKLHSLVAYVKNLVKL